MNEARVEAHAGSLTSTGRRVRGFLTAAFLTLLVVGTFWGQDDHFPFGPFRMYSTTNDANGTVKVMRLAGITEDGDKVTVSTNSLGLRPAEVEGQALRFTEDPELVRHLVEAYENFHPEAPLLDELSIMIGEYRLEDRRPVGYAEEAIATWKRP